MDAVQNYYLHSNANTCGAFATSRGNDAIIASARAAMADFFNCDKDEVVFGQNMTTITFALARAIGRVLEPGDEIIVTTLDHDANVAPWRALEDMGMVIRQVDIHESDCTLDLDDLKHKINANTKLVAVGYASNAVGTINPVAEITKLAHAAGALMFIDAVHYAPHGPIDVRALDCDFLVCSPYKFFGPHMGTLYGKREHRIRSQIVGKRERKCKSSSPESPLPSIILPNWAAAAMHQRQTAAARYWRLTAQHARMKCSSFHVWQKDWWRFPICSFSASAI
jgi:selenocysteine lyase/cysteine desulfurase